MIRWRPALSRPPRPSNALSDSQRAAGDASDGGGDYEYVWTLAGAFG